MKQVVGVSQARLGGVGSLREGTSASSREGNGIGEPGRGTEWVAGRARGETQSRVYTGGRAGSKMAKWGNSGCSWVLVSQHKQQPQAQIAEHQKKVQ